MPEALRDQIARTSGDLTLSQLLGGLAMQFGQALKKRGALRSAISELDPETGKWVPVTPHRGDYNASAKPHTRGAVLVSAVFDAFLQIYRQRTEDLVRLATNGTGILPEGRISNDLVERLAKEATTAANHVLNICIRALDYCPPMDVTFGNYLRALITADFDLVPEDDGAYRVAFVSAFRARGIFPSNVSTLSVDALLWDRPGVGLPGLRKVLRKLAERPKGYWTRQSDRFAAYVASNEDAKWLHGELLRNLPEEEFVALGLVKAKKRSTTILDKVKGQISPVEVHSVRPVQRIGPDGQILDQVVIEITQRWKPAEDDSTYRGGCTVIYDLKSGQFYLIRKRVGNRVRVGRQQAFKFDLDAEARSRNYFDADIDPDDEPDGREPFAFLHRDL